MTAPDHNRVALVTGAGRGIGRAIADTLAGSGFQVVGLDRNFLTETPAMRPIEYDLEDLAGIPGLIDSIGRIDVLVNNAGVQNGLAYDCYTDAARTRILRINLEAPVELIRAVAPRMIERRRGRIITMTSVAAFMSHTDLWYGITKAGAVSLTRSVSKYLGPYGIQVNAVAPGPIESEMLANVAPERRELLLKAAYTGRTGRPGEVAEVVRWLAMDAPDILNGAVIDVTDGSFLR